MSEALPEPTLDLFPDKQVAYEQRVEPSEENPSGLIPIYVPVDEIDSIEDSRLRDSLWRKFRAQETNANHVILVYVNEASGFSDSYSIRKSSAFDAPDEDGVTMRQRFAEAAANHAAEARAAREAMTRRQKVANWFMGRSGIRAAHEDY